MCSPDSSDTNQVSDASPVSLREQWLVGLLAFVAVPAITLAACGGGLLDRPFWADETLSWLISADGDLSHANAALAGGIDTNAPLIHWFYRLVGDAFGHTPVVYRSASMAFLSIALAGLYFVLRQTVTVGPAIVGCIAFWSLPIVIAHQTETRFYGPLVAAAIWTCHFVGRRRERTTLPDTVGLAVGSVALCASHYFGVVALLAIAAVEVTRAPRRAVEQLFPIACGFVTTLCLWPLLASQRAVLADVGGTWLPDDFWTNLQTTAHVLMPGSARLAVVGLLVAAIILAGRRRVIDSLRAAMHSPLAALALFGVAMLAFDRLVQPVLVPRYFMPVLPAVALLVAAMVAALPRRAGTAAGFVMVALLAMQFAHVRGHLADPQPRTALAVVRSVERLPADVPILIDWRGHLLPIHAARPDLRSRLAFVDDPRATHPDLARAIPFERRMVEVMQRFYGFPRVVSVDDVRAADRFVLVTEFPEQLDERFPQWNKRQLGELTFELRRNVGEPGIGERASARW